MPELPEVETVKRSLEPYLPGRRIVSVEVLHPAVIHHPAPEQFAARLCGRSICALSRRGKYLLLHLDDGQTLVVHLRMTGRLLYTPADHPLAAHSHAIFHLENGRQLRYVDVRRFGGFWLLAAGQEDTVTGMQRLGVEPLSAEFDAEFLQSRLASRRIAIKVGLLDQHVIAGLGNIYVDEILFAAGIHPLRSCQSLTRKEWQAIAAVVPDILQSAIANNGTTFRDFLDGSGKEGENMPSLQAYGRAGQPCLRCGKSMERILVGGRGSCFCPSCQKIQQRKAT